MKMTLIERLVKEFPQNSRSSLMKWIKLGRIYVEGRCVRKANHEVLNSQKVELKDKVATRFPFDVLYEDSDLIIVNKPPNLLSVASLDLKEKNLHQYLKDDLKPSRVYPVHRLDREVSGPLMFAKTKKAHEKLKEDFYHKRVKRIYWALLEGKLEQTQGSWESHLQESSNYKVHVIQKEHDGKWSKTHYKVLKQNQQASLLELKLETGRKNQLRVHTSEAKFPIIGDVKYGASPIEESGIALIAKTLDFSHPLTKKLISIAIDPPAHFNRLLKKFKLK